MSGSEWGPRPFRFGVAAGAAMPGAELLSAARLAEELGYEVFSVSDHLNLPGSELAPLVTLAAVAAVTERIELQPLVLANDFRHPALLAKETATLDLISDGRCAIGLGAGWLGADFQLPGIPFDTPTVRIARLRESVQVVRGLHSGEAFTFGGEHYRIDGMTGSPLPVRNPMPLMIGGAGRYMLSVAARLADTVSLNLGLPLSAGRWQTGAAPYADVTDDKVGWVREAAGERFSQLELQATVFGGAVTDADPQEVLAPLATMLDVEPGQLQGCPHVLAGTLDECVSSVQAWRERWGISYVTVPLALAATFAPVVDALRGH
ncbi:MAG: TIGR03621 family F420-dependent LLM class oxidoreductase [Halioglobus sp.]|nr:TIGR03621 family F420-dependent LLM class oxidoreductase [Halioglobus sp.]